LPAAWLAVFAVIAVALVKIAFVDGMDPEPAVAGPAAQVSTPVIQASRATLANKVEIRQLFKATPRSVSGTPLPVKSPTSSWSPARKWP
jgi:hypothetical protein